MSPLHNSTSTSHSDKIELILDSIKDHRKRRRKNTRNKIEAILGLLDVLVRHNYPNHLIYSKIIDILKDYDIPPRHIVRILDFYGRDPSKAISFHASDL